MKIKKKKSFGWGGVWRGRGGGVRLRGGQGCDRRIEVFGKIKKKKMGGGGGGGAGWRGGGSEWMLTKN